MYPVLSRIIKKADYLTLIAKFPDENVIFEITFIFLLYQSNISKSSFFEKKNIISS